MLLSYISLSAFKYLLPESPALRALNHISPQRTTLSTNSTISCLAGPPLLQPPEVAISILSAIAIAFSLSTTSATCFPPSCLPANHRLPPCPSARVPVRMLGKGARASLSARACPFPQIPLSSYFSNNSICQFPSFIKEFEQPSKGYGLQAEGMR